MMPPSFLYLALVGVLPFASAENLIEDGDGESGKPLLANPQGDVVISVLQGNPVQGDRTHRGKFCTVIRLNTAYRGSEYGIVSLPRKLFVDPSLSYRIGLCAFTDSDLEASVSGYAYDGIKNAPMTDNQGRTWQYATSKIKGPLRGWKKFETTIGPVGADTTFHWLPNALWVRMDFWLQGGTNATLYVDDITQEQIESKN